MKKKELSQTKEVKQTIPKVSEIIGQAKKNYNTFQGLPQKEVNSSFSKKTNTLSIPGSLEKALTKKKEIKPKVQNKINKYSVDFKLIGYERLYLYEIAWFLIGGFLLGIVMCLLLVNYNIRWA